MQFIQHPHKDTKRVFRLPQRVIFLREVPEPSPETVSEGAREVHRLSAGWERFSIIVEFSSMVAPDYETRHRVSHEVLPLKKRLDHVAVVTQTNVILKVAIYFIARISGFPHISVHRTRKAALKRIREEQRNLSNARSIQGSQNAKAV